MSALPMSALLREIRHNKLLWLLAFVPVVFVAQKLEPEAHTLLFLLSLLAIVPLAALPSHAPSPWRPRPGMGWGLQTFRAVRRATDPLEAQRLIAGALPPVVAAVLQPAELDSLHQRLKQLPEPPGRVRLSKAQWPGALGVFVLVFLATFPAAVPFLLMQNAALAMRISSLIAIVMLFVLGYAFGRRAGSNPWVTGISMVILGSAQVGMTIALGG